MDLFHRTSCGVIHYFCNFQYFYHVQKITLMSKTENQIMIPEETVISKIYLIRNTKVMLDMDLAELYGVETKQLKGQ